MADNSEEAVKMKEVGQLRRLSAYLLGNWERVLFGVVGLICLVLTFKFIISGQIAAGSALFGMAFFSFFYSNLARFKRFKGLGFEAELWEDKQKEAADLIDRLKSIVSTYTREIVMNNIMRGRWGGGESWQRRWAVFDELTGKHTELGQEIDFSPLKREADRMFIFDICSPLASSVRRAIGKAKSQVRKQLTAKYGSPIKDTPAWNADQAMLGAIRETVDDLFDRARSEDIAGTILNIAENARAQLMNPFGINLELDPIVMDRLGKMSEIIKSRPIVVTEELIEWTEWRDDAS